MAAVHGAQAASKLGEASDDTRKAASTEKRDALIANEKKYQKVWADAGTFESDAPTTSEIPHASMTSSALRQQHPKFMGTFAYPYMNGVLHAGHAFTISKVEFATGYARMQGKRTLFPLGFHCTGMAIKACADKLVREIAMFGPLFEGYADDENIPTPTTLKDTTKDAKTDVTKFMSKKGKTSAKSPKAKYQFQIMLAVGIQRDQIHLFADAYHWVKVFPETGKQHLTKFGLRVDWRRSFVTTDANPYYDSFVRWQMTRLKELGKIKFGKRYTVYSPKDGQACLDHDRSQGEGITSQEYTAVKLKVLQWPDRASAVVQATEGLTVYFVAATLRPETMYGQVCCFVSPTAEYGIFKVSEHECILATCRAARNMSFQNIFDKWGVSEKVASMIGSDVIGTLVHAPLSVHESVRVLPMETVSAMKGTGVVTSVPSDSPDDYATLMELAKKADHYGIDQKWAQLEIVPIISSPKYGTLIAPALVQQMKITSPKDPKLSEAKEEAYKEGFYNGTMVYGKYAGQAVSKARELVKADLIDGGYAFHYAEPDGLVVSRSGDECVAAHLDQWYLNYGTTENGGDGAWCDQVLQHVRDGLNTFSKEAKNQFEQTLGWLGQWACARSYGLGSKLPWDTNFLVESLSDSTIYPAYYTVAHYLHKDIFGAEPGMGNITPDQMTDEVWDYVFARTDSVRTEIKSDTLQSMRREFEYWYPLDLRVSGKDLVQNHLTFFLYIHVAIWPPEYWPKGVRPNGHLLLNGDKMSKSTGNFLTLDEAIDKFGADATRIAIADAGDGIEDANFEESVANSIILKLYELRKWCEDQTLTDIATSDTTLRSGDFMFWDQVFQNEMVSLVHETRLHYDSMLFKNAIKSGFYDFTAARDFYRETTKAAGIGLHHSLVQQYIELQALLLTPIAPHWAEYIWQEALRKPDTIQNASFPDVPVPDAGMKAIRTYVRITMSNITSAESTQQRRLAKGKSVQYNPNVDKIITVYFAKAFPAWQSDYMSTMQRSFRDFGILDVQAVSKNIDKKDMKKAMPFIQGIKKRMDSGEDSDGIFNRNLPFDEAVVLQEMSAIIKQVLRKCKEVRIVAVEGNGSADGLPRIVENATPGSPVFSFANI